MTLSLQNDNQCCGHRIVGHFYLGVGQHTHPEALSAGHPGSLFDCVGNKLPEDKARNTKGPFTIEMAEEDLKWHMKGAKCYVSALLTDMQDPAFRHLLEKYGFVEMQRGISTTGREITFYLWTRQPVKKD